MVSFGISNPSFKTPNAATGIAMESMPQNLAIFFSDWKSYFELCESDHKKSLRPASLVGNYTLHPPIITQAYHLWQNSFISLYDICLVKTPHRVKHTTHKTLKDAKESVSPAASNCVTGCFKKSIVFCNAILKEVKLDAFSFHNFIQKRLKRWGTS